jgi:hypothetical protein
MVIIEELAPEFEIELVVEAFDPFEDFPGLFPDVAFIVKTNACSHAFPSALDSSDDHRDVRPCERDLVPCLHRVLITICHSAPQRLIPPCE